MPYKFLSCTLLWLLSAAVFGQESTVQEIEARGLFAGMAILIIDGQQRTLKDGETSPEGVQLLSATSKQALVRINGETHKLDLSRSIGTHYQEPSKQEVRLKQGHNGHYFGAASIDGHTVQFVVDTGASAVVMNSLIAARLGIDYRRGISLTVSTAQGSTIGYQVLLRRVIVGGIEVNNVRAIVMEGEYPLDVLLGNTFLGQVDVAIESGVMVLQAKF